MLEQLKKSSKSAGIEVGYNFRVKIPFSNEVGSTAWMNTWNEICATAIEMFGLPGEKYTCRFTPTALEFWFRDDKDAMMFELTCG